MFLFFLKNDPAKSENELSPLSIDHRVRGKRNRRFTAWALMWRDWWEAILLRGDILSFATSQEEVRIRVDWSGFDLLFIAITKGFSKVFPWKSSIPKSSKLFLEKVKFSFLVQGVIKKALVYCCFASRNIKIYFWKSYLRHHVQQVDVKCSIFPSIFRFSFLFSERENLNCAISLALFLLNRWFYFLIKRLYKCDVSFKD